MKFTCERDLILKEISIAHDIISSKNIISILSNVYLEAKNNLLIIKATDLKVSIESEIPVEVINPGSITIYCDKFLSIIKNLPPGEIEFENVDNKLLYVRPIFKKIDFHLRSTSAEKYPEIQKISDDKYFEFSEKDILEMISNTIFAVSNDETRYFMSGVYLENSDNKVNMVASDGKRLSFISKPLDSKIADFNDIIIPTKILILLKKLLTGEGNISVCITEKNIFIKFRNHKISSSLIEGQFPNYQRVIPEQQEYEVIIEKKLLENAIKRVSLLVEHKSRRIFLQFMPDNLIVSSEENEIGLAKEEVPCQYKGPDLTITLNYLYLIEPLICMQEENICVQFTDINKAVTIKPHPHKDYLHIIMPMQAK